MRSIPITPSPEAKAAAKRRRDDDDEEETTTTTTPQIDDDTTATTRDTTTKRPRRGGVKNPALIGRKFTGGANASLFIRQWAWKREMKTERERFVDDYEYPSEEESTTKKKIVLKQKKFKATGFASTVWDSAIVLAKYAEKTRATFEDATTCVELGAGCGLLSAVMRTVVGVPRVIATDLEGNLELLTENVAKYGVETRALTWGDDVDFGDVDVVVASDVVYWNESMKDLVKTLRALAKTPKTRVLMSYGRNRQALETFLDAAREDFETRDVPRSECDELYSCTDVDVIELRRRR